MATSGHRTDSEDRAALPLHVCGGCGSGLVHPLHWEDAGAGRWRLSLRCPNCWWTGSGTYGEDALRALDEELDLGTDALIDQLRQLARDNMAAAVEGFTRALRHGAVLPEDF